MRIEHIYWFSYFDDSEPSVRYRAKYPLDELGKIYDVGHTIIYPGYHPVKIFRFIKAFSSILFFRKKNSLVVLQKIHTNRVYANALKLLLLFVSNTVYDIDDAEYLRRPANTIRHFMSNVSLCTVGSEGLKAYAAQLNKNTLLLTSPVIDHKMVKTKREDVFTVGWIGYYGAHKESLSQLLFPAVKDVDFELRLVLLGVNRQTDREEVKQHFADKTNIIVEMPSIADWENEQSVYEVVKRFDVGVAPLIDNEFNRSKSAFKMKQYLSCGVPVIASPTGENTRFLKEGENGYFCRSVAEYKEKLGLLKMMNNDVYGKMSKNAAASHKEFSVREYCASFMGYFSDKPVS